MGPLCYHWTKGIQNIAENEQEQALFIRISFLLQSFFIESTVRSTVFKMLLRPFFSTIQPCKNKSQLLEMMFTVHENNIKKYTTHELYEGISQAFSTKAKKKKNLLEGKLPF